MKKGEANPRRRGYQKSEIYKMKQRKPNRENHAKILGTLEH